ncbi:MAG TPA: sterol desaturase family protein [Chitinophagaceae bacterium]|nr:sterol desaturase family protein [Chitinophagaceae bacterium]
METYGKILLIAMPAFLLLVLFEKWYGWRRKKDTIRNMDMISSLTSGVTNVTKEVLGLSIIIIGYSWLMPKVVIYQVRTTWLTYIIAFIAIDFAGYWVHRWSHHINLLWNLHIVHHSSEDFNLACALRQSISMFVNPFTILLLPAALLGVPDKVIATVGPLQLFAQFWYHTQHIRKMGFLEHVLVTPSHHRVHHAINKEYLDKNLSQIFIIWDKLFGTFQKELKETPPVYGITRPVQTWNPIKINFQHVWLLMKDAWRTRSWKDKFGLWFKRTGYRPADVIEKYPVYKIEDVYNFRKYEPRSSRALNAWSWVQMLVTLLFVSYLFGNIASINQLDKYFIYWYGAFIFLSIYALTELMDRNPYAIVWEVMRCVFGLAFLYRQDDWFGAGTYLPLVTYILMGYFIISIIITAGLARRHKKEDIESSIVSRQS